MGVSDGVGDALQCCLAGGNDDGVILQAVQSGHAHAQTIPNVLSSQQAHAVVHIQGKHGAIGDGRALHAPLVPEDAGHQAPVGPSPDNAQTVEGAHHTHTAALGHASLEALQVQFTDGLLVGPCGDAVAPFLLIVEGEVLGKDVDTPILNSGHLNSGDLAGQPAILGIVLEIPTAIGGAVDVGPGAVDAGIYRAVAPRGVKEVLARVCSHK